MENLSGAIMKKRKMSKALDAKSIKNPVAKFAFQFNNAQVFKDKTKYQRSAKHKGKDAYSSSVLKQFPSFESYFSIFFA